MIDQVMKKTSCHDEKIEAYCNVVRALEDKFYGTKLNHAPPPRKYNEEADKLAKIAAGRITVPRTFSLETSPNHPSISVWHPRIRKDPHGVPSNPAGVEPMDEDPSNEAFVLSLLNGYSVDEAEAMETELPPAQRIGGLGTSPGLIEGNSPRIGPKPGASLRRPSRSL
jgi:hypothetical protein